MSNIAVLYSQGKEVGIFVGGSNFIGDTGRTTFVNPNAKSIGGMFRYYYDDQIVFRANMNLVSLNADDLNSNDRKDRSIIRKLDADILQLFVGMEFNFLDFRRYVRKNKKSPYVGLGLSANVYESLNPSSLGQKETAIGIPLIFGIRFGLLDRFVLSPEVSFNYLLTDSIDGNNFSINSFGNQDSNDWYVLTGITLGFFIDKKLCFCD